MDVEAYISQMEQLLVEARPVPLSASVMIHRRDFEELVAGLRSTLPEELREARWVLKERDEVLAQAAREAEQILADARLERDRTVAETEVVHAARREAERIVEEAREHARVLRLEAEDYVDSKLANFEIVLARTMKTVEKGRERLRGRLPSDELTGAGVDDTGQARAVVGARQLYDHESAGAERDAGS
ncbi:MAG: ATPase [Actinomycetota bacterium]|nr:ATPase [Actinomycetota bacterium]